MNEWRVLLDNDGRDSWTSVNADNMEVEGGVLLFYRRSSNKMSQNELYKAIKNWKQVKRNSTVYSSPPLSTKDL